MPKKITNPLREGLPSKIYLLAYGDHLSGYEIARKIYGTRAPSKFEKGEIPPTAKVYGWLEKLEKGTIVSIKKEGKKKSVTSNVDPLINEVEKDLKNHKVELSDDERYALGKVLDSNIFREWIKEIAEGLYFENDIDAVKTIMSPVSRMALIIEMIIRKFPPTMRKLLENPQHFDKKLAQVIDTLERRGENTYERVTNVMKAEKMVEADLPKSSMRNVKSFILVFVMPYSLLQKLAILSDPVDRAIMRTLERVSELPKIFTEKDSPKTLDKLFQTLIKEFGGGKR
jgi:hypothetical protein